MKKIYLLFALLMVCTISYTQSPITFGPKVGFTSYKLTTDMADVEESCKNGFEAGAFVRVKIKKFYLQPELYYSTKGGILKDSLFEQEIQLNTLNVPVLFGYTVIGKDAFNFRVFAGPIASFVVNKTIKLNGDELADDIADKSLKDAILGAQFGAGVDILMFTLDVRYEVGFNDLAGDDFDASLKSNGLLISLGWKIL